MTFQSSKLMVLIDYIYQTEQEKIVKKHLKQVYHNSRSRDIRLWDFIMKYWDKPGEEVYLQYRIIDKMIFAGKTQERNKSIHRLYKTIKSFLIMQTIHEDDLLSDWLFLQSLTKKDNPTYDAISHQIDQKINSTKEKNKDTLYYFLAYQFYRTQYKHNISSELVNHSHLLTKANDFLNRLYRNESEKIDVEIAEIKEITNDNSRKLTNNNTDITVDLLPAEIKERIHSFDKDTTSEEFLPFFESIMGQEVSSEKKTEYLTLLINHLYLLYLNENNNLFQVHWELLVEYGFEQQLFFENGHLIIQHFINLLSMVSRLDGETTNRHDYITKRYLHTLSNSNFKNGQLLARLFKAMKLGQNVEIIRLLKETSTRNAPFFIKIRTYPFLIKAYYAIRNITIDKRDKIIKESNKDTRKALYQYKQYLNSIKDFQSVVKRNVLFVDFTLDVLNAKRLQDLTNIQQSVYDNPVVYKNWLYEIIDKKTDKINQGFTFQ